MYVCMYAMMMMIRCTQTKRNGTSRRVAIDYNLCGKTAQIRPYIYLYMALSISQKRGGGRCHARRTFVYRYAFRATIDTRNRARTISLPTETHLFVMIEKGTENVSVLGVVGNLDH